MGYSIIADPDPPPRDGRRRGPAPRASQRDRWTASSGPSRRSQTTAAWLGTGRPDIPVPIVLVGGLPSEWAVPLDRDRQPRHRARSPRSTCSPVGRGGSAIVTGPMDWWESQQRIAGWRDTLIAAGIPPSDELVFEGDWTPSSGEHGLYRLVERVPDLDAVFASNDQMALGVLHARPPAGPTRSRRALRRRGGRHRRGLTFLAAAHHRASAPARCRRARGRGPRPDDPDRATAESRRRGATGPVQSPESGADRPIQQSASARGLERPRRIAPRLTSASGRPWPGAGSHEPRRVAAGTGRSRRG